MLYFTQYDHPMKALSVQQPWTWAILNGKPIENRDWYTPFRGTVLLHAGKIYDYSAIKFIENLLERKIPDNLQRGGIIGQVEIVDCVKHHESPWFCGKFGFVLKNALELPFLPCRGKLGFFEVEYSK